MSRVRLVNSIYEKFGNFPAAACFNLQMLAPLNSKQWDMAKAAHLLNRAAFGGSPQEIKDFCALGLDGAVNKVLNGPDDSAQFPKPDWATPRNLLELRMEVRDLPEEEKKMRIKEQQRGMAQHGMALINWWLNRMHDSPNPAREKLTLFWHGHFATSIQKVKDPYLMWQQNETLRANALGNFGAMTKAIARDPAMMVYLDTNQSRRQHPNENFARELMELFTLGIGNYTEEDIQQAARAFTGFKIDPRDQTFRFAQFQQDTGEKKFFGKSGNFNGDDIVDMILGKPECARYISKKVWEFLAYEDPKPAILDHLTNFPQRVILFARRLSLAGEIAGAMADPDHEDFGNRPAAAASRGQFSAPARAGAICAAERERLGRRQSVDHDFNTAPALQSRELCRRKRTDQRRANPQDRQWQQRGAPQLQCGKSHRPELCENCAGRIARRSEAACAVYLLPAFSGSAYATRDGKICQLSRGTKRQRG
jgi:hypothetical protein